MNTMWWDSVAMAVVYLSFSINYYQFILSYYILLKSSPLSITYFKLFSTSKLLLKHSISFIILASFSHFIQSSPSASIMPFPEQIQISWLSSHSIFSTNFLNKRFVPACLLFFSSSPKALTLFKGKTDVLLNVQLYSICPGWRLSGAASWFRASAKQWVKPSPGISNTEEMLPLRKRHSDFSFQETGWFSYHQLSDRFLVGTPFTIDKLRSNSEWQPFRRI